MFSAFSWYNLQNEMKIFSFQNETKVNCHTPFQVWISFHTFIFCAFSVMKYLQQPFEVIILLVSLPFRYLHPFHNKDSHIKYLLIIISSCLNQALESRCKFYSSLLFCSINFTRQHSIHQFMPTLETIKSAFTGNKSLFFHSVVITFFKKNTATNTNTYLNVSQTNSL